MIKIVDCGSQLTQNIARRIRELGVFTEIVPFYTSVEKIKEKDLEGIIISGGPSSVYDKNAPLYTKELLDLQVPVLGICYGQQSMAYLLGGKVTPAKKREYGETTVTIEQKSKLFHTLPEISSRFRVWMSHGDIVEEVPPGFEIIARSQQGHIAAMQKENIYAVQFHPEVDHSEYGRKILDNFLDITHAERNWDPEQEYERIIAKLTKQVKRKVGIGGISGGVDSTTASVLINQITENYHPIFINNGLLRLHEAEQVRKSLETFDLQLHYVDATERFLSKLEGVTDPDEKRRIIGYEFIAVFEEEAKKIPGASYLVQGTLYPDVIESVPVYGASSKIKRHHNVGGLPEKLGLELVEPFRHLFKDEVRTIAEKIGLPREIIWRHPFPGPGLAIRIVGDVTKEKLDIVRHADAIFIEELKARGLYDQINQAFAGLLHGQFVGVMGDAGTYESSIGLRAVVTNDFMTADWYDFEKKDFTAIANRITNEVKGVNRVFYDKTQKPPGTIEWE